MSGPSLNGLLNPEPGDRPRDYALVPLMERIMLCAAACAAGKLIAEKHPELDEAVIDTEIPVELVADILALEPGFVQWVLEGRPEVDS